MSEIDISNRNRTDIKEMVFKKLPVEDEQMMEFLRLVGLLEENRDMGIVLKLDDESEKDDVPRKVFLSRSSKGCYMELHYPMKEWNWDHPLILANDHLKEREAVYLLSVIFGEREELPSLIKDGFVRIDGRVFGNKTKDPSYQIDRSLTGVEMIRSYESHPELWLPFSRYKRDRNLHADPEVLEIGWNAGVVEGNRPFFAECWATEGITLVTAFVPVKGWESLEPEEVANRFVSCGYLSLNENAPKPYVQIIQGEDGEPYYSINFVAGDEDGVYLGGGVVYPYEKLEEVTKKG